MFLSWMWRNCHCFTLAANVSHAWICKAESNGHCAIHEIDFITIDGDANLLELEDDIRGQLALVGFDVKSRILSKEAFNEAHSARLGALHMIRIPMLLVGLPVTKAISKPCVILMALYRVRIYFKILNKC
jgi:hypothetical protein